MMKGQVIIPGELDRWSEFRDAVEAMRPSGPPYRPMTEYDCGRDLLTDCVIEKIDDVIKSIQPETGP